MKEIREEFGNPRFLLLVLGCMMIILGTIMINDGAATTIPAIACVGLIIMAHLNEADFLIVIASAIMIPVCAGYAQKWHYTPTVALELGCALCVLGLHIGFLCLTPADAKVKAKESFSSGGGAVVCVVLFGVNVVSAILMWTGDAVYAGMVSHLSGALFFIAVTYETHVWLHISQLFSAYWQVSLLATTLGECSDKDVCAAGSAISWLCHLGFMTMIAWKSCPKRLELVRPELVDSNFIIICACVIVAIVGAVLPLKRDVEAWIVALPVISILLLVATYFTFKDVHPSLINIGGGLCLGVSSQLVTAADVYGRSNPSEPYNGVAGYSLLVIALWLAHIVYHTPFAKLYSGLTTSFSDRCLSTATTAFLVNFLGLVFSWVYGPSSSNILSFLTSVWFFFTIIIERSNGFYTSRVYTCLFITTYVLVMVMPTVAKGPATQDPTLGQLGACMVMLSHLVFVIVLSVSIPQPGQIDAQLEDDGSGDGDYQAPAADSMGYQYEGIVDV